MIGRAYWYYICLHLGMRTRMTPLFLILSGLVMSGVVGCADLPDDEPSSGDEALAIGSRWRSPLTVGEYDGDHLTLSVYAWAERQRVVIRDRTVFCEGPVDVADGKATVEGRGCNVTLEATTNGIRVSGHIVGGALQAFFARRPTNALVGWFSTDDRQRVVQVESSDDHTIRLSASDSDVQLLKHATATQEATTMTGQFFEGYKIEGRPCLAFVQREAGDYRLTIISTTANSVECPLSGVMSRR